MRGLSPATKQHFRRDGLAKKSYTTKDEAKQVGKKLHKQSYLCRFCGKYHLGGLRVD